MITVLYYACRSYTALILRNCLVVSLEICRKPEIHIIHNNPMLHMLQQVTDLYPIFRARGRKIEDYILWAMLVLHNALDGK